MITYAYSGRDHSGQAISGEVRAQTREMAVSQLIRQGVTPVKVNEKKDSAEKAAKRKSSSRSVKSDELILFTRQMYALTRSGVPIIQALRGLAESTDNGILRKVMDDIVSDLVAGSEMATAFRKHPKLFSSIYVSMIHIGESTGNLDRALKRLIAHLEVERDTKKRIKSAMRYPIMVIFSIAIALVIITMFVIPNFTSVFAKLGADLPLATKILVWTSDFMLAYWHLLLGGLLGFGFVFLNYIRKMPGQLWWDRNRLRFPLLGSIFERIALARFSRSFAMMLQAGVPILTSLNIVAGSVGNRYIGDAIISMKQGIERGDRLTNTAAATGLFTPLVLQMMSVGEETGAVDQLLEEVADFYEQEVDYELKQLSDAIEPLLLVFLGVLIIILALGVFLPVWELSGVMTRH
ncbi:MAG TPA: MSHA biogenesis protein MshG [Oceanospirillales bacterium]|nr:MSHA biogenesis protein MshG [Oceanospirillaceae bacterium]HBS42184.1 MSHA biogenesis protein MshG [Oceanospirillales bacterium]|tara:strand:+ start:608 stop:1828 length:1221 start_codon:yes stop_codon:yes gene_type:complete